MIENNIKNIRQKYEESLPHFDIHFFQCLDAVGWVTRGTFDQ